MTIITAIKETSDGVPDGWWFQAIRLPFQFVLIAWAYWYTDGVSPLGVFKKQQITGEN